MYEIIIGAIAGILAGFGTGFAGLSAAVFISPMLIAFLNVESYTAIGIALASDVLASAVSAATYAKHKNIDLKRGRLLMILVLSFAVVGSVVAYFFTSMTTGENIMGYWLIIASLVLGINFILFPGKKDGKEGITLPLSNKAVTILCGIYIGFVCGFQGTGGGLMMLFVLNVLLGFAFKKAVGTSVFIMSITALIGAISHFLINGIEKIDLLIICIVFTFVGAQIASVIANKIEPRSLKRITGVLMTVSGVIMLVVKLV